jgi:hypothetical protein
MALNALLAMDRLDAVNRDGATGIVPAAIEPASITPTVSAAAAAVPASAK